MTIAFSCKFSMSMYFNISANPSMLITEYKKTLERWVRGEKKGKYENRKKILQAVFYKSRVQGCAVGRAVKVLHSPYQKCLGLVLTSCSQLHISAKADPGRQWGRSVTGDPGWVPDSWPRCCDLLRTLKSKPDNERFLSSLFPLVN